MVVAYHETEQPTEPTRFDELSHVAHEALTWSLDACANDVTKLNAAIRTMIGVEAWARRWNVNLTPIAKANGTNGHARTPSTKPNAAERRLHVLAFALGRPIANVRNGQELAEMFGVSRETIHLDAMELRRMCGICWPGGRTDCKVTRGKVGQGFVNRGRP